MPITIGNVLDEADLASVAELLPQLMWSDGTKTAGAVAREVKRNRQADLSTRTGTRLRELVQTALRTHPVVQAFARPAKWSPFIVSQTGEGGGYGTHIDNAFMGAGDSRVRTDLSFTLFLTEPDSYEGGELNIDMAGMTHSVKGARGDLVIYPSTTLHQVAEVTRGRRIVCVGWIQSLIRSGDQREILFDLDNLKAELLASHDKNSPELLTLSKTLATLTRMWGE